MNRTHARGLLAVATIALLGSSLTGCAPAADATGSTASASSKPEEAPAPEAPADLTGEWVSTNSESEDSWQEATITADTIEVNWVTDEGSTRSLYWAGTYTAPTAAGAFTWDSQNDTEKTSGAMLASGDPTKKFSYADDVISYDVSALGTTKTVTLERK